MLSYSIWFSAPNFWMGGGLESRCVGRVYGADGDVTDICPELPPPLLSFNSCMKFDLHRTMNM